jgi:hypothetical protein
MYRHGWLVIPILVGDNILHISMYIYIYIHIIHYIYISFSSLVIRVCPIIVGGLPQVMTIK